MYYKNHINKIIENKFRWKSKSPEKTINNTLQKSTEKAGSHGGIYSTQLV